MPWEVILVDTGNSQIIFEKRLTMTNIAFFPFDSGNGPIRSTEIIFHGVSGTAFGFNRVFFPKVSVLTLWHLLQPLMYLAMSHLIVGQ